MLPDFDENGNLPVGIYTCSIEDVINRYRIPDSKVRTALSDSLRAFYNFISGFALRIYVDGSFITSKQSPGDVDIAVVLPQGFSPSTSEGHRLNLMQRDRKRSGLHIFPYPSVSGFDRLQNLVREWQIDRNGNPKGIILVEVKR